MYPSTPFPRAHRWLRLWLIALNVGLLVAAVVLAITVTRRALFLALLVPLAIAPFSYARLRLYDALEPVLARWPRVLASVFGGGIALDFVLAAQLATGRASEGLPMLHGPGVSWIGPVAMVARSTGTGWGRNSQARAPPATRSIGSQNSRRRLGRDALTGRVRC